MCQGGLIKTLTYCTISAATSNKAWSLQKQTNNTEAKIMRFTTLVFCLGKERKLKIKKENHNFATRILGKPNSCFLKVIFIFIFPLFFFFQFSFQPFKGEKVINPHTQGFCTIASINNKAISYPIPIWEYLVYIGIKE